MRLVLILLNYKVTDAVAEDGIDLVSLRMSITEP